jgi:hypothetical protein
MNHIMMFHDHIYILNYILKYAHMFRGIFYISFIPFIIGTVIFVVLLTFLQICTLKIYTYNQGFTISRFYQTYCRP